MTTRSIAAAALSTLLLAACQTPKPEHVGPLPSGQGDLTATYQLLHPAGQSVAFAGRPIDLILSPDGKLLLVKDNRGLVVIEAATFQIRQELKMPEGGGSTHGLAITKNGSRAYVTTAQNAMFEANIAADGKVAWGKKIPLLGPKGAGNSHAGGITLSADEQTAYVCLSRNNTLGVVDLRSSKLQKEIPVGVAPFDVVLSPDGMTAYVSNWGGRLAKEGDKTAKSSGADAVINERGIAASGTVSIVDLAQSTEVAQVTTGLHPSDLELGADGKRLYVANANSDSVTVIDTISRTAVETITTPPDPTLPFGSAPNALALSPDGTHLVVANGGNNALAVVSLAKERFKYVPSKIEGFIPTAWFPGAVITDGKFIYVANVKGIGSRKQHPTRKGWNSHDYLGTVSKIEIPTASTLQTYTRQVKADARVPEVLRAMERNGGPRKPVPVPKRLGDPSVFEHLVYIIKENRTYDQLFGDMPQANSEPSLCTFGREVTPNHHAIAEQFALLDNFYCNGVLSADGHAWAVEGFATDYLEKSFGGFTRSYPYGGDDPLSFAPTGFIWDNVLLHGLSFRNYGEMNLSATVPNNATFKAVYDDHRNRGGKVTFKHDIQIEMLRRYSCPESPGWNLRIPDQIRADVFLKEFEQIEKNGIWPNLVIIYLPSDHTSGTRAGGPTPRAQVADNDLAVGRIVDRISHSKFWPKTCIFVIEDDPQAGFDHVDGHRSICLVASPYTKRGAVISDFYNQTSVLHTMEQILGLPPMNQMDALSPLMTSCFTSKPNLTPYTCQTNRIALDELNKATAQLTGRELFWAEKSEGLPLDDVDQADEDTLNRIIWHSVKGANTPYPSEWAGAHGKGLKKLGLKFGGADDDDDD
jgi:YVTN family beta-propeller protein